MKKLDIVAILLLFIINWFQLAILYRYDYFTTIFTVEQLDMGFGKIFTYGHTIVLALMVIPRWLTYLNRRQTRIELGNVEIAPFLNYHPEDVK